MTAAPDRKRLARALPLVLVPIAFVAIGPWLKAAIGGPMMTWVAALVGTFVMGYALYLSICLRRTQDEVQKAQTGFATQWGTTAGQIGFMLLLVVPTFRDFMTNLIHTYVASDEAAINMAMMFGACGVILLQAFGTVIASVIWWKSHQ